jgi:serine/threonine protein kinase
VLAVDYLQAKDVCHRDIKLDNLLLVVRLRTESATD